MLEEFLSTHREALIARCRSKAAVRRAAPMLHELWYGIPSFLDQLIDTLRLEQAPGSSEADTRNSTADIAQTATQHGAELLRSGFTVAQVVHDYGDLCQAITEMATEQNLAVSAAEFHTLNRCLDDAIADAVTEFGRQRDVSTSDEFARTSNQRLGFLAHELRNLINTAILAVGAIRKAAWAWGEPQVAFSIAV